MRGVCGRPIGGKVMIPRSGRLRERPPGSRGCKMSDGDPDAPIRKAAAAVRWADAVLIGAGAGMGVDSGLPDFRGREGFWRAYPPFAELGLSFAEVADPRWFRADPALAWGFYGHRSNLYRSTRPHAGFDVLRRWSERATLGGFVFTSNVDGQFQAAGFDEERLVECHGSLGWLQCLGSCGIGLFRAPEQAVDVDPATFRARPPLPACPGCGSLARPNVLMFGDGGWEPARTTRQEARLREWLERIEGAALVVIEIGAGEAIPTVRWTCERAAARADGRLIRINPRDTRVPPGEIGVALGALEGLRRIDEAITG